MAEIEKGEAEVLVQLLEDKFGSITERYHRLVDEAGSAQLLTWAKRVLSAEKIEDVFKT